MRPAVTELDPGMTAHRACYPIRDAKWSADAAVHRRDLPGDRLILTQGGRVCRDKAGPVRVWQDNAHSFEHIVGPIAQRDPEGDFARCRAWLTDVERHERRPATPTHLQRRCCCRAAH